LLRRDFPKLQSWRAFEQAWFERFYMFFGPASRPLFASDVEKVVRKAYGIVLDVGPGSGDWLYLMAPDRNPKISKLLLVEPNINFHAELRRKAEKLGLTGKYEIIGRGIQDLHLEGVQEGSIDTFVTTHVLCSIPTPQAVIKQLFPYLKSGGQWLVYEHVRVNNGNKVAETWQAMLNTIRPYLLDGCHMDRDTEDFLLQAGEWKDVKLGPGSGEGRFSQVPHVTGSLLKA